MAICVAAALLRGTTGTPLWTNSGRLSASTEGVPVSFHLGDGVRSVKRDAPAGQPRRGDAGGIAGIVSELHGDGSITVTWSIMNRKERIPPGRFHELAPSEIRLI